MDGGKKAENYFDEGSRIFYRKISTLPFFLEEISIEKQTSVTTVDTIFQETKAKKTACSSSHQNRRSEESDFSLYKFQGILAITKNCVVIHLGSFEGDYM